MINRTAPFRVSGVLGIVLCCAVGICGQTRLVVDGGDHPANGDVARSTVEGSSSPRPRTTDGAPPVTETRVPHFIFDDQVSLWTSPIRARRRHLAWLVPSAVAVTGSLLSDTSVERHLSDRRSLVTRAEGASDAGLYAFIGAAGGFYLLGKLSKNPHATETGLLSAEAATHSFLTTTELNYVFGRQGPDKGDGGGRFRSSGSSFPSNHAAAAWSIATVISNEYPGWATKLLAYGSASAVSALRVGARRHHPSDAIVGAALGYVAGKQALQRSLYARQRSLLDADSLVPVRNPLDQGSTYVPLDSWVYEAFDRLHALGQIQNGTWGVRPWTRLECARLLKEALLTGYPDGPDVASIYRDLEQEFAADLLILGGDGRANAAIDSVYVRFTGMSGNLLTDDFHFGQTIINDYGRPYQEGFNQITGISAHAEGGPVAVYFRGEYQHAPFAPALPDSVRAAMAASDRLPIAPAVPTLEVNRLRLLDSYIVLNVSSWQFSFGKQSLWWGPGSGGDLMLSNNAEPLTMLRLTRTAPFYLPGFLKVLGDTRSDSFLGQVNGYHFLRLSRQFALTGSFDRHVDPQPYIWGQKIAFQPTPNLEFGVSWTTVFAGLGRPLTLRSFLHSLSLRGNLQDVEPGDRRAGFDFRYRLPGLRNWLVLYNGSMTEDQPSPIGYPRHSAMNPGLYLSRIPKAERFDLRVESVYTNLPNDPRSKVFYQNAHYADGYTNYGHIMGSWVGSQARGYQAWMTYWSSAQSKVRFGYRRQSVDPSYLGGGTLQDFTVTSGFRVRHGVLATAGMQYERWRFPVISTSPHSNLALSLQVTYRPGLIARR